VVFHKVSVKASDYQQDSCANERWLDVEHEQHTASQRNTIQDALVREGEVVVAVVEQEVLLLHRTSPALDFEQAVYQCVGPRQLQMAAASSELGGSDAQAS